MKKLTPRLWISLITIGLMGQFAWTIENMYFNVFLYNTISTDPGYIAAMVAASAIVATLTTLLMGAVSDRIGKRKAFISGGYLLWGISTAAFGFISVDNGAALFPAANAVAVAAIMVIVMDCIMTFFGSTANDAAFNAYVTDTISSDDRGRVEGVLAILPLISMLVIFGLFDGMTQAGNWQTFFLIFGVLVTLAGIASIFIMDEAPITPQKKPLLAQITYGFKPSVIKAHTALYLSLLAMCIFTAAVQIFFPYLIIYMQHYLLFDSYAIVLGVVLIFASIVSVIGGRFIDKIGKLRFVAPAGILMLLGLVGMYFTRSMAAVMIAGSVMMSGYMLLTAALSAQIRELTPPSQAGHFQGIRMIFAVMLPMIIGPFIGAAVIRGNAGTYVELGQSKTIPTPEIFLASAIFLLLLIIPIYFLRKQGKTK
ncbi:MAG: MFS transporter [Clostridiales bacterium]|nr:MFS transporter [Clostridiales bacterium]